MRKILTITLALGVLAGCQTTTPASRSNESAYKPEVKIETRGDNNRYELVLGDGLYASADGGGDTQRITPTQTNDIKPSTAMSYGGAGGDLAATAKSLWASLVGDGKADAETVAKIKQALLGMGFVPKEVDDFVNGLCGE